MSTIGIPIKLLHEAQGHVVTVELTNGQVYRGKLVEGKPTHALSLSVFEKLLTGVAEDNCNVQLRDVTGTARDGRVSHLEQIFIRGSHVRFFVIPDMLRNAPMFRNKAMRARGAVRGRGVPRGVR
jgi:small nuclear ribonucleoprotein D3